MIGFPGQATTLSGSEWAISPRRIREIILEQSRRAHVGHIGSALSIADIIATLYDRVLRIAEPEDPDRDRFILSKGHAALAVYAALFLKGWLSEGELDTFCADNSLLGVHPENRLPGIDFATGSLGHGLSFGSGAALAARLQHSQRKVYVLVSDAECNEGSLWEAVMFAAHHRLANLVAIVDVNQQQALGYTSNVLDLSPLSERWRSFGWSAYDIDGHDTEALTRQLTADDSESHAPRVLVAQTVFGKGVSYMENRIKWHYMPMSDEEYAQAYAEVASSE